MDLIKKKAKKAGSISSSDLVLFAFATAFFSRILDYAGVPSLINFFHFIAISFACVFTLANSQIRDPQRVRVIWNLIVGLFIFFTTIVISAFINRAGAINAVLDFVLLTEPFLLILSMMALSLSMEQFLKFRRWLIGFLFSHLFIAYAQKYIFRVDTWEHLNLEPSDRIQGVFFLSGAGHVVGASVSLTFALYYLISAKETPLWFRIVVALAAIWHVILSDAKQVILAFMVAGIILFLLKLNDIGLFIQYVLAGSSFGYAFWWCTQNLEAFKAYNTWSDPELYGPDGDATLLKTVAFRVIPSHYESILNWFFGLGPGHTVGRLGGWMVHQYKDLLTPLGVTIHQASFDVWSEVSRYFIGSRSSMFSPLFGWAGIWGDLGLVGLATYLYLAWLVWHYVCVEDISKFFLLTVFVFGLIFSQMEEPGYMLSVAAIIGLRWQEIQLKKQQRMFDLMQDLD